MTAEKKTAEVKIKNSGTKEFPYYLVMIGKKEFCATNSENNAKRIVELLSEAVKSEPAEGAEEILNKTKAGGIPLTWLITPGFQAWNAILSAMQEFTALHAQRLADKMVEGMYPKEFLLWVGREEIYFDMNDTWIFHPNEKCSNIERKTTDDLFDYWKNLKK